MSHTGVNIESHKGATALFVATASGHAECVRLLCRHGARRSTNYLKRKEFSAETIARCNGYTGLTEWLRKSREWTTPLHYVEDMTAACAVELIRNGSSLNARACPNGPTPVSIASELVRSGDHPAAHLVLRAAEPWSVATHHLFPEDSRSRAYQLLLSGYKLSKQFESVGHSFVDVWRCHVLRFCVMRGD